jgi:hypothetical protein
VVLGAGFALTSGFADILLETMIPCLETVGVLLLAAFGLGLGRAFGKMQSRWWLLGFVIPFVLLLLIGSTRRYSQFEFVPPMSWLVNGRTEFALGGFITTMLLATPAVRLPRASTRRYIYIFMGLIVFFASTWPFFCNPFGRKSMEMECAGRTPAIPAVRPRR